MEVGFPMKPWDLTDAPKPALFSATGLGQSALCSSILGFYGTVAFGFKAGGRLGPELPFVKSEGNSLRKHLVFSLCCVPTAWHSAGRTLEDITWIKCSVAV